MLLGFKQSFPWHQPTNFREKILASVGRTIVGIDMQTNFSKSMMLVPNPIKYVPKIHTIREDKHNRWKTGNRIQMVYRGKNYSIEDHFNKDVPELQECVSIQHITIKHLTESEKNSLKGASYYDPEIRIDGKFINISQQDKLAINDGFDDLQSFLKWFNKDFEGKIIHWSNFRY